MTESGITIERGKHAQQFVTIGNREARDGRLSFRARGLHHYLLSLPPGWRVTTAQLAKENPEGREAIRTALNELISLGYVTRSKRQDERGRWSTTMTIHDGPQDVGEETGLAAATEDGFPGAGEPGVGELGAKPNTVTEELKDQKMVQGRASRRARASGAGATRTVDQVIREVRTAIVVAYGERQDDEVDDATVLGLYAAYVNRPCRDLVAYMRKIFDDTPELDTLLQNVAPVCPACRHYEDECKCPAASAA